MGPYLTISTSKATSKLSTPTLDIVLPLAAHKAMSKGLYRPFS